MCQVRFFLFIGFSLLFFSLLDAEWSASAFAQEREAYCDPYLRPQDNDPVGYRLRKNRCEGRYIREVSSTTLVLASFTEIFDEYDLSLEKDLIVEWSASGQAEVQLRAQGLKRRLYYRMDTKCSTGSATYQWPLDVLSKLQISKKDLGVVGWTRNIVDKAERDVYLPLTIRQNSSPKRSGGSYRIFLLPGRELQEIFIRVFLLNAGGKPQNTVWDQQVQLGYYPADRGIPISIPISTFKERGFYYAEIGVTLKEGGASTLEFWFYADADKTE